MPFTATGALARTHLVGWAAVAVGLALLAGCVGGGVAKLAPVAETTEHGYVVSPMALEQVPVGSSKDQVLIALGSPSTAGNFSGEVFYYISQTRRRSVQFLEAKVIDQKILAVYFDADDKVERIAQYGLQDGKVFDFVSRTTPTGGKDLNFIQQMLSGVGQAPGNVFGRR